MPISLKELLAEIDAQDAAAGEIIPSIRFAGDVKIEENDPPRLHQIVEVLREQPILMEPTLNWIQTKQAQIAEATLQTLYTAEQILEMKRELGE